MENKLNPWLKLTSGTRTDQSSEFVGESDEAPLYVGPLTLVGDDTVIMVFVLFDDRNLFVHNDVGDRWNANMRNARSFRALLTPSTSFDLSPANAAPRCPGAEGSEKYTC